MLLPCKIVHSEAKQVGSLVNPALFTQELNIIALFKNSLYMEDSGGKLFCLCNEDLALGPLSIQCSNWEHLQTARLRVGQKITFKDSLLLLHPQAILSFATVKASFPPDIPPLDTKLIMASIAFLQTMFQREMCCSTGLAPLLPLFLFDMTIHAVDRDEFCKEDAFLQESMLAITTLVRCFEGFTPEQTFEFDTRAILRLIGLGPGLTPSGDDFIVGVMLALRYCKYVSLLDVLVSLILSEEVQCLTNKISYAYLKAAALGHVSSILYAAAHDFCVHSDQLSSSLGRLSSLGHSSGWDAFSGFAITMKILASK